MSIAGAWQPATGRVLPADVTLLGRVVSQAQCAVADCRNVPRYCLKYSVLVLAMLGLLQLWLATGDGPIPAFHALRPAANLDPRRTSHSECVFARTDEAARWQALGPALAILSEVNPAVADWVRRTREAGKLQFANRATQGPSPIGQLAKYDALRGHLTITSGLFAENDGTIAAVLCHEFRHARQRMPKTMVYTLSFLWIEGGDPAIVENDALLYEQDANLAIFGQYQER